MRHVTGLLVAGLLGLSSPAVAQVCLGMPSLSAYRGHVSASALITDGAKGLNAGVTTGGSGLFSNGSATLISFDDGFGSAYGVDGTVGYQVAVGTSKKVSICPVGNFSFSFGPNNADEGGVDVKSWSVGGGFSLGSAVAAGDGFALIPRGTLTFQYAKTTLTDDVGDRLSGSDNFGQLGAGLGFAFSGAFVLQPFISIPLGLDGSDPTFGVTMAIAFGRR